MKIVVTQKDIDAGKTRDPFECPVALACKRAFGVTEKLGVEVHETWLRRWSKRSSETWQLPTKARLWVERFDYDYPVAPFCFELLDETLEHQEKP